MRIPARTRPVAAVVAATASALTLLAIGAGAAGFGTSAAGGKAASRFPVTGYVLEGGSAKLINAQGSRASDIGLDGALVSRDGASLVIDSALYPGLRAAHRKGLPASLLVANYDNRLGDFSADNASHLLKSEANRAAVVAQLAGEVEAHGWDGITIDLEALDDDNRQGMLDFLTGLRAALPAGKTIDIDIPASAAPGGYQWKPFDRVAIAKIVDHVVIMSYDQHYQGGTPGPIGGLPWVKKTIDTALTQIPRSKLRLGIAGYGYLWRKGKPTRDLSDAQARGLAAGRGRWSAKQKEWTVKVKGGGVIWWSDARSMKIRIALAKRRGLQGAAVWRLGSADNFR